MSRTQTILLAVIVPVVLVLAYVVGSNTGDEEPSSAIVAEKADDATDFEYDYVIPFGTAEQIAAGEEIEIVPSELTVEVGDAIRIVNEDTADHIVGVFFVAAGETLTQRFNNPAVLEGECSVHPSGAFTLRVVERQDDA